MRWLITGNMGYVGSVLVKFLRQAFPQNYLMGFDNAYFGHLLGHPDRLPERYLDVQVLGDIREFPAHLLEGVDGVVHLAAISNDPMGHQFAEVTDQVNRQASVRLAQMAAQQGVSQFVVASSCSLYGSADDQPRRETDPVQPLTAYAQSKAALERDLANSDLGSMVVTSLRFATACGVSDRLRLDLVLNDFVASALWRGAIQVLSNGSPWRPLIDVEDMARAVLWALTRSATRGGRWLAVNAGSNRNNWRVGELARMVQDLIPGSLLSVNHDAPPDRRSYRVDFSLYESLAVGYLPQVDLETSVQRLLANLRGWTTAYPAYRLGPMIRLNALRAHIEAGRLDTSLRWTGR